MPDAREAEEGDSEPDVKLTPVTCAANRHLSTGVKTSVETTYIYNPGIGILIPADYITRDLYFPALLKEALNFFQ